jgi:hypothetical protein
VFAESAFAVGGPKVVGAADGLFGTVVEVVAEGANLALEFDGGDEAAFIDDKEIPELGGAEIAGQGEQSTLLLDGGVGESVGFDDFGHQGDETVHVLARRDSGSLARIRLAASNLFETRFFTSGPELPDGAARAFLEICQVQRHG